MMPYMLPQSLCYHQHLSSCGTIGVRRENPANSQKEADQPYERLIVRTQYAPSSSFDPGLSHVPRLLLHLGERSRSLELLRGVHLASFVSLPYPRLFTRHPGSRLPSPLPQPGMISAISCVCLVSSIIFCAPPSFPFPSLETFNSVRICAFT